MNLLWCLKQREEEETETEVRRGCDIRPRREEWRKGSALAAGPLVPLWTVMGWMLKHSSAEWRVCV